jgi:hypothetical protein
MRRTYIGVQFVTLDKHLLESFPNTAVSPRRFAAV